jgi:hypothetical protein
MRLIAICAEHSSTPGEATRASIDSCPPGSKLPEFVLLPSTCLDEYQRRFVLESRPAISGEVTIMFHRRSILKVHRERRGRFGNPVPASTKGTFILSLGQVCGFFYDRMDTIVVYTFVVEVVNPFEMVARVCSHMVASGKS